MTERIFQDDPEAINKLQTKLEELLIQHKYWKSLKQEPRTYQANETDAMKKCYMLPNISANIREVKKKIALIQARKEAGINLVRKPTYIEGKKRFFYEEIKKEIT